MKQNMHNRKFSMSPGEALMFLAGALFCLVLITTAMMGGLFARYTASSPGGDSARVAAFDVKINGPKYVTCEVTALHPGEIVFTVKNDSEVAVSYSIRVELADSNGCGILVTLDGDAAKQLEFRDPEKTVKKYDLVGTLSVAGDSAAHTLSFEPLDWTTITKNVTGESQGLTQDYTVYIDVVQID